MVWITSDHHFNHTKIIEYCDRPFDSTSDMNEYMIAKWNSVVRPDDMVLHLGDFALGMNEEEVTALVSKLHGTITLVRGNHEFDESQLVYSEEEEVYRELFTEFCNTIAIEERINLKLQRQMCALRYRPYMVEFCE